ncbi:MAG: AMP-binding protein [Oscillospiraceae bacterium]|nr:AMP-binding protein [Oscillospiraceae bacterium]
MKSPLDEIVAADAGGTDAEPVLRYRGEKLRETLGTALRSRFYREKFKNADVSELFGAFSQIPLTRAADVARESEAFLCVKPDEVSRVVTLRTSGTTASPKRLFFTDGEIARTEDFFARGMTAMTRRGGRVLIFLPRSGDDGVTDILSRGLARFGCGASVFGAVTDADAALGAIRAYAPDCVVGLPSHMLYLARSGVAASVGSVLLCSDYISPSAVAGIEDAWNCRVFSHYGLTETLYGGAVSCGEDGGMHVCETDLYFEIVGSDGNPAPDGGWGEIAVTTLTRKAMPLVRFATGDAGRFLTEDCPCGSKVRRLDRVRGRIGSELLCALDDAVLRQPGVLRYSVSRAGNALTLSADGDAEAARSAAEPVARRFGLAIELRRGAARFDGAAKRVIKPE